MKKKLIIASMAIVVLLIFVHSIVKAEYSSILDERREELQEELDIASQEMEQIEINLTKTLEELNILKDRIENYISEINTLDIDLLLIYNNILDIEKRLEHVEQDYELQKGVFEKRVVAMYELGEIQYLDVLLSSRSLSEFVSNYFLISEIAAFDIELLDTIEREKILIDTIKEILEEKRLELKVVKDGRERTVVALENSQIIQDEYAKKLSIEELETQVKIDTFRTELDKINAEILNIAMQNVALDYVGGELAWPAPGNHIITSRFGMRIHPIFRIPRMHSGVDVATPTGARIVAVNDGIVVESKYTTGYGNMVMINHGGGVVTVYAHGIENTVDVGQKVRRGDVIMRAGSTGWSTGPHLHFEVRINGSFVDPLPLITRQNVSNQTESNGERRGETDE